MEDKKKKSPKITLYEAANFKGRSKTFTKEHRNLIDTGFNDYTSSVIVEGGTWLLYQHCNYAGNICVVMEGDKTNLVNCKGDKDTKIHDFNDRVSSLKLLDFDLTDEPKCTVYVDGFEGRSLKFMEDILDLGWYEMRNKISSIRVHSGAWVGYDLPNFRGAHSLYLPGDHRMASSAGGFRNDRLSSLRALQIKPTFPTILDKMEYHIKRGNCKGTPMGIFSWRQKNDTTVVQKLSITKEKSVTTEDTYEFKWDQGTKVAAEYTAEVSFPLGSASLKMGIESHYNIGSSERKKTAKTEKWIVNYPSEIPAKSTITLESTLTQGKLNVPFTAHFHQGERKWTEEGFFLGTQYYGLVTKFSQE